MKIILEFSSLEEMETWRRGAETAPTPTPAPTPAPAAVPTAPVAYTIEQLSVAAMQLKDLGKLENIRTLNAQFGVVALTQLKPEQFNDYAAALQSMGVKI